MPFLETEMGVFKKKRSLYVYVCFSLCIQGSQEVSCVVDEKSGDIVLSFESCQISEESQFIWKKDYKEITEFSKGEVIKTEGSR